VNTDNSLLNCGGCGTNCPQVVHGTATCTSGQCGYQCDAGYASCNGSCVDTTRDQLNCGGCGVKCATGEKCTGSVCTKAH
jgi:hypothetical protein